MARDPIAALPPTFNQSEKNEKYSSGTVRACDAIGPVLEAWCLKEDDFMKIIDTIIPNMGGVEIIREKVRQRLAYWSVFAYFTTIIIIVFLGKKMLGIDINEVVQLITTVAGILGGVVGAIIGFYYKSNSV